MFRTALAASMLLVSTACSTVPMEPPTCPGDGQVADLFRQYVALQPAANPLPSMTVEGSLCGRDKYTTLLGQRYGRIVGYKAGLTSTAVQQRFNYPAPVRGTLFEQMIVADGTQLPARFGVHPLYEADLIVSVKDSGIHDAKTPLEVLRHLDAIYPFIELPDLLIQDPKKVNGAVLNLTNVAARLGVLGKPVPVRADTAMADALRDMTVRLVDGNGKELDRGSGSAVLGHPLNAVVWLADDLRKSGITLKPGDLLSLGSFSKLMPPQPGSSVRAVYEGLPGTPEVSVRFR